MTITRQILVGLALVLPPALASAQPEPGPENGGLRLRLDVSPRSKAPGYEVRLELLNVTSRNIVLRACWLYDRDKGSVRDYVESATSIETYPAMAPWVEQVVAYKRTSPQPEQVVKAGEALALGWRTDGPRLKNKVVNPLSVQNPELAVPGLYAVHATLRIEAGGVTTLLRSNEQSVSVGGSRELPKHTYGRLWLVDVDAKTARLNLGSLHKIVVGDEFEVRTGLGSSWKLTITEVQLEYSIGRLEPLSRPARRLAFPPPRQGAGAELLLRR